jgi:hypothetical protein
MWIARFAPGRIEARRDGQDSNRRFDPPDCQGLVTYSSAFDPGTQPDTLNLLEPGGYYDHPNPARDECVFGDGRYQVVPPLPAYRPGILNLGDHRSHAHGLAALDVYRLVRRLGDVPGPVELEN